MASRRTRSGILATALLVAALFGASCTFLPTASPRTGAAAATAASVAAVSLPAHAEEGFLNFGKVELGGGFALNLDIPETGIVNIVVLIGGLLYLLAPLLSESMSGREAEIQTDIDDAIAKYTEASERLAEAEKAKAQADQVIGEINASIEKDQKEFEATIQATTKATLERQAASAEGALKELEANAATRVEAYIQSEAVSRGLKELSALKDAQKTKFMDAAINAL